MTPSFQPKYLRSLLRPLTEPAVQDTQIRDYLHFYNLTRSDRVDWRLGCFHAAGYRIAAQLWVPEKPRGTLLLLHGYFDHMGLFGHVLDWALAMNLALLACDLPGHGLSSGRPASIDGFNEYQHVLQGLFDQAEQLNLPTPWHVLGQSTGAAIIVERLLCGEWPAQAGQSILLAPLIRPRAWTLLKSAHWLLKPFVDQIPRLFMNNSGDARFVEFIRHRDPLQAHQVPMDWIEALIKWVSMIEAASPSRLSPLIVQGELDGTVDWAHNLAVLSRKFHRPAVLRLPAGRHHLVNEVPAVRQRCFEFIGEYLGYSAL